MPSHLKQTIVLVVVIAASTGGYFLWNRHGNDGAAVGSADGVGPGASTTPSGQPLRGSDFASQSARDGVYAVLDSGASLATAIAAVAGPSGELTDARMISLVERAALVCNDDFDPYGALGEGAQADPTRAWAVARVVTLCEGFDQSKYKLAKSTEHLSKLLRESGKDVAASESLKVIRTAPDYSQIYSAGQILLETGEFPLSDAIPDGSGSYGTTELMTAWAHASTLIGCREAGECGPNSLEVAAYCSNVGCPPGVTMQQALQQELSTSDYRAVSGFYGWMLRQRKG